MRQNFLRQAVVIGAIAVSGCSYPHAGPTLPEGATSAIPATSAPVAAAPATPAKKTAKPAATTPAASDPDQDSGTSAKDQSASSFDNLDVLSPGLKGKLAILRVGSDPGISNILSVFAGLKNKTNHPLSIEVQTIYKDRSGNPLNSVGSWIPMRLQPHEQTEYRSSSISAEAVDFHINIRSAVDDAGSGGN